MKSPFEDTIDLIKSFIIFASGLIVGYISYPHIETLKRYLNW